MPGKIIQCLKKTKTENPLVLIDEVWCTNLILTLPYTKTLVPNYVETTDTILIYCCAG